jgi:hypothetical protein
VVEDRLSIVVPYAWLLAMDFDEKERESLTGVLEGSTSDKA